MRDRHDRSRTTLTRMAMGKQRRRPRQQSMWVPAAFLTRLTEASGIATPTWLTRFDRTRKKKGANDDWTPPQDLARRSRS